MEGSLAPNGILNILKPPGMTSFDVVSYLRGVLKTRKIGHTGTLDPGVAGVLPVCTGNTTKAIEYITDKDKVYRAELTLGISTDTQDITGSVVATAGVSVNDDRIAKVFQEFTGSILQIPPMYSAVKVGGKKLYELARSGITVERSPRQATIYSMDIIRIDGCRIIFEVACSKGTYIRTLCSDIGDRLGCGGTMSFLVRLKSGMFGISDAVTLQEVKEAVNEGRLSDLLIPVDEVFREYRQVILADETAEKRLLSGAPARFGKSDVQPAEIVRVYDIRGGFLALGEVLTERGGLMVRSKKQFL